MLLSLAVFVLAAAVGGAALMLRRELAATRRQTAVQSAIRAYATALAAVQSDPRQLLVWHPLAQVERRLMPDVFAEIDRIAGGRFPFSPAAIQSAHARWTTEWLTWERAHDTEYKLKASSLEENAERRGDAASPVVRARIEAVDREKLEKYQQRYEEYVRVAKALAALEAGEPAGGRV